MKKLLNKRGLIIFAFVLIILLVIIVSVCIGSESNSADSGEVFVAAGAPGMNSGDVSENTTQTESESESISEESIETESVTEQAEDVVATRSSLVVVIDPGHQSVGNNAREPIGPGASETKAKVTGGTHGNASGLYEYQLSLQISLKLKAELERRGYNVLMTRESHDVDISNSQRAEIANNANADAFVRIHANGSENAADHGALTICQTANNPYNANLYADSYALSKSVLDKMVASTGALRERIWETDTMSGINWAKVPSTIVEVGYMTNHDEDLKLATEDYQNKIAVGIANGIDEFLSGKV
jgi:N-acetylmuramoyl-L-alanine amidase